MFEYRDGRAHINWIATIKRSWNEWTIFLLSNRNDKNGMAWRIWNDANQRVLPQSARRTQRHQKTLTWIVAFLNSAPSAISAVINHWVFMTVPSCRTRTVISNAKLAHKIRLVSFGGWNKGIYWTNKTRKCVSYSYGTSGAFYGFLTEYKCGYGRTGEKVHIIERALKIM